MSKKLILILMIMGPSLFGGIRNCHAQEKMAEVNMVFYPMCIDDNNNPVVLLKYLRVDDTPKILLSVLFYEEPLGQFEKGSVVTFVLENGVSLKLKCKSLTFMETKTPSTSGLFLIDNISLSHLTKNRISHLLFSFKGQFYRYQVTFVKTPDIFKGTIKVDNYEKIE